MALQRKQKQKQKHKKEKRKKLGEKKQTNPKPPIFIFILFHYEFRQQATGVSAETLILRHIPAVVDTSKHSLHSSLLPSASGDYELLGLNL